LRQKHNKPRAAIAGQLLDDDNGIGITGVARLTLSPEFLMPADRDFSTIASKVQRVGRNLNAVSQRI
jgi:hypothetical protein